MHIYFLFCFLIFAGADFEDVCTQLFEHLNHLLLFELQQVEEVGVYFSVFICSVFFEREKDLQDYPYCHVVQNTCVAAYLPTLKNNNLLLKFPLLCLTCYGFLR